MKDDKVYCGNCKKYKYIMERCKHTPVIVDEVSGLKSYKTGYHKELNYDNHCPCFQRSWL